MTGQRISTPDLRFQDSFSEQMLPNQHESLGSQKWRGIDQFAGFDSRRDAKEEIHRSQPAMGAQPRHSFGRNTEIRQQPSPTLSRCVDQLLYNTGQGRLRKAIEKEMRYQQIILMFGQ